MKLTNISGVPRHVAELGHVLVEPGAEIEVPTGDADRYLVQETIWARAGQTSPSKRAKPKPAPALSPPTDMPPESPPAES